MLQKYAHTRTYAIVYEHYMHAKLFVETSREKYKE